MAAVISVHGTCVGASLSARTARRAAPPTARNGEAVDQDVFAFMTTEPNELTSSINHERMPVLVSDPADFETWLSGPPQEALRLARSYAAEQMRVGSRDRTARICSRHDAFVAPLAKFRRRWRDQYEWRAVKLRTTRLS